MNYRQMLMKLSQLGRRHMWFRKILLWGSKSYYSWLTSLSDVDFANKIFSRYSKQKLNLEEPQTYNEKLWWLKFHYRNPLMQVCSDKFAVRQYVTDYGLEEILIPIVGVYDSFDTIPFDKLHEPVFVKCTKGSGGNAIFDPAKKFDYETQRMVFTHKLGTDYTIFSREWNYGGTQNRIICEKVLKTKSGELPEDYKILCFNGVPKLVFFSRNVCSDDGQHNVSGSRFQNIYEADTLTLLPIETGIPANRDYVLQKPENYEMMLDIARKLSCPFPFCRVDLYNIDGAVYFGEITFFPSGGNDVIKPDEWSLRMGEWIDITRC